MTRKDSQKICLCMIVKNESHVIERCLSSVLPLITSWSIVDTGSTDGTQAIIPAILRNVPGELHERPWVDFAHNRTESLRLASSDAEYLLVMDADDCLVAEADFKLPQLEHDAYALTVEDGNSRYERIHLVRRERNWRYEGVVHEFITCDGRYSRRRLDGLLSPSPAVAASCCYHCDVTSVSLCLSRILKLRYCPACSHPVQDAYSSMLAQRTSRSKFMCRALVFGLGSFKCANAL